MDPSSNAEKILLEMEHNQMPNKLQLGLEKWALVVGVSFA